MTASEVTGPAARQHLSRLRLVAQGLAPVTPATPADVVRRLTCVQAQDFRSARSAVALRAGSSVADVDVAINAGEIVRSWPMRGTLHLVEAAQLRGMLALNAERTLRAARRRHEQLGIGPRDVQRARTVTTEALCGGHAMTRSELFTLWEQHGIGTGAQRGAHLAQSLCLRGHLVLGPVVGRQQRFVLFDEWVKESRPVDRAANIADWALCYFRSHGPATIADFRWWSGLLHRDLAPVWDTVRVRLDELVVGGTSYFLAPETLARWADSRHATLETLLTPAFDEILLGYADRTPTLRREHADLVVPGGNGMFKATVIDGGRAVATWRRGTRKNGPAIEVSSFDRELSKRAERAVLRLAARYPFPS